MMAWIKTPPPTDEEHARLIGAMRAMYPEEYATPVAAVAEGPGGGIVMSHNLIPLAQHHIFSAHAALMSPELPLTRSQHEMIATVVSVLNRCFY
jgi:hypothetical protein